MSASTELFIQRRRRSERAGGFWNAVWKEKECTSCFSLSTCVFYVSNWRGHRGMGHIVVGVIPVGVVLGDA